MASYYRRFIPDFAKTACALHELTKKGLKFLWTEDCQSAFASLRSKLTRAPVLAFPQFDKEFILETDANIKGLGAVLAQCLYLMVRFILLPLQVVLSPSENNYAATELETLAVVWAISHFNAYFYGHEVIFFTDHSAVK